MTKVEANQAQVQFAELISRVEDHQERIVIEQAGQAVAAVISYADLQRLEALEDALDAEFVRRAKAENPEFVSLEDVVEGYNQQHGTNLTIKSVLND
jgi:prevent-host-death family protein